MHRQFRMVLSEFKFQSDSINTLKKMSVKLFGIKFKFQSDSINTVADDEVLQFITQI